MSFSLGIVGLPNAGKSTLFNAVVRGNALTAPYPFTTIDPNIGTVAVPDKRIDAVAAIAGSAATSYASVKLVDIAGLVKGASKGEGLGNQFLGHVREVDGIIHVVKAFGDAKPREDAEVVDLELALADLAVLERQLDSRRSATKSGNKEAIARLEAAETVREHLWRGGHARELGSEVLSLVSDIFLITAKPMFYVANVDEKYAGNPECSPGMQELKAYGEEKGLRVVGISARFEEELMALEEQEREAFAKDAGISVPASQMIILCGYGMLNLISFFTANKTEARSWSIRNGSTAVEAAGKVHTQMARGFIRAEVIAWDELVKAGSMGRAKELGLLRIEGRDYGVKDGDVMYFRFSP